MYFPISEPHSWKKRSATQPQTIYSEFPKETLAISGCDGIIRKILNTKEFFQ